jgi:hypothetical protein
MEKPSTSMSRRFEASNRSGTKYAVLVRNALGGFVLDARSSVGVFHIEEGPSPNDFAREFLPQPILPPPPHTEFPLTMEEYRRMRDRDPDTWRRCIFSPHRQTGYLLDPDNDPRDRQLINAWRKHNDMWFEHLDYSGSDRRGDSDFRISVADLWRKALGP